MNSSFQRTISLIGEDNFKKLSSSKLIIFGIGGVGSYAAEALARSGIGSLTLVDDDIIDVTNINRQIHALSSTIGLKKVEVMKDRILDINPNINIDIIDTRLTPENINFFKLEKYDYVIDAIDSMKSKLALIIECKKGNLPIISAMGAGNKLDPTCFKVDDIYNTNMCPLARKIRKTLREENIRELKVVWSDEKPRKIKENEKKELPSPTSISFVPPVVGLIIAGEVVKDLIE